MNTIQKATALLLCIFMSILNISCNNSNKKNKDMAKFKWEATVTCPHMYPTWLLSSILIYDEEGEDGYTYLDSGGFSRGSGWGGLGALTGGGISPLPGKLIVTWLSWVEAKVYSGTFDLPKEKMEKLFKAGFNDVLNKRAEYEVVVVGLAPEGEVFLWVWGNGSIVEVGHFQATEKPGCTPQDISRTIEMKTVEEMCDYMIKETPDIAEYLAKHKLNNRIWNVYRERFTMRPIVEYMADSKGITDRVNIRYLNGELQCLNYEYLALNPYVDRARPESMEVVFSNERDMFSTVLKFDEAEIFDAYRKMYGDNPNQEVDFVIRFHPSNNIFRISLRKKVGDDKEEVILKKTEIDEYQLDERSRPRLRVFNQQ